VPEKNATVKRESQRRGIVRVVIFASLPLITAALATASFTLRSVWTTSAEVLLYAGFGFAAATIVLQVLKTVLDERVRRSALTEADAVRVAVTGALQKVSDDLAQLPAVTPSKQVTFLRSVSQSAANAVFALLMERVPGVRVNVFHAEGNATKLVVRGKSGRGARPAAFLKSTPDGEDALDFIQSGEIAFYPDLSKKSPEHWPRGEPTYATFIAVPIQMELPDGSGSIAFGMITVDAPRVNTLTQVDIETVVLLADAMAIGFSIVQYS
jgi:hypothetical protein